MFSATYTSEVKELSREFLKKPKVIQVARESSPVELIDQSVVPVDRARRRELLSHLIGRENWQQVLVFTRTKHGANRLADQLDRDGLKVAAIHGNKTQSSRLKSLEAFKKGKVQVLVATDIAARGIDIKHLPHVVNFDLPQVAEDYVHRIGRTGRAGCPGHAISLVSPDDRRLLWAIERLIGSKIKENHVEGYKLDPKVWEAEPAKKSKPRPPRGRAKKPFKSGPKKPFKSDRASAKTKKPSQSSSSSSSRQRRSVAPRAKRAGAQWKS